MELRRVLLRILLIALGLAAFAGVVGVVTAAGETIWRIVGTAGATAVAVAIMLPFSMMMDKAASRTGGLAGMAWAVGAYVLALGLIWDFDVAGANTTVSIGRTLVSWVMCGLPAVFLLSLVNVAPMRIAAKTGVALAGTAFGLMMVWAWDKSFHWFALEEKWFESGLVLLGVGGLAVVSLVHAGTNDRRWWRWVGVVAAAGAWVVAETGIIQGTQSLLGRQVLAGLTSVAAVLGLANLAMLVPLAGLQEWIRWGTIAAAGACAVAINVIVSYDRFVREDELWARIATGSAIVAGCGSLALLVLARINRRGEYRPDDAAVLASDIAVVCPRCGKWQKIRLGGDACSSCGLRIEVTIEEPRCPKCGYLVYMLSSPVCPECGSALAASAPGGSAGGSRVVGG